MKQSASMLSLIGLLFELENGEDIFLRNVGLHGIISQKTEIFITTAVKNSNLSQQSEITGKYPLTMRLN
jgi:hypothetical protein